MSYTGSKAQTGDLTTLSINTGTVTTPVYTLVGEITDLQQSGKMNATDDVTNLQSTAEEFIATLLKPGKYDLTLNRISGDAGQVAVLASFNAQTTLLYQIQLLKNSTQTTTGDKFVFTSLVEEFDDISSMKADKAIKSKVGLKVSGPITLTVGS